MDFPIVRALDPPTMNTIAEQISAFEATRQAKSARMHELMHNAAEGHVTLDAPQTEEYDTLDREVKSVDAHLGRLRELEKTNLAAATPVPVSRTRFASMRSPERDSCRRQRSKNGS